MFVNISTKYQDAGECVHSTRKLSAGTVVILDIGRDDQISTSLLPYETRPVEIVSARPVAAIGEAGEGKWVETHLDLRKDLLTAFAEARPETGTPVEVAAMNYHAQRIQGAEKNIFSAPFAPFS